MMAVFLDGENGSCSGDIIDFSKEEYARISAAAVISGVSPGMFMANAALDRSRPCTMLIEFPNQQTIDLLHTIAESVEAIPSFIAGALLRCFLCEAVSKGRLKFLLDAYPFSSHSRKGGRQ